uniref:Alanine racemase n=1 Tax=Candidatus Aschnera chinzeii TaxID=1485666 RepID=A0AAT9G585_9ENTR|nr:MAG: alanine racemase [Candidatus Aschnera chinzeii]
MENIMQSVTAFIDINALVHNIKIIKKITNSKIIAIVKANAYGHGILKIAKTIKNLVDAFGISRVQEGIILRTNGINNKILLLEDFFETDELFDLINYKIDIVLQRIEQLELLEKCQFNKPINIWMKLDTGLHRLGIKPREAEKFYQRLLSKKFINKPINIISHFSSADDEDKLSITQKELESFNKFTQDKPGDRSIAASAGILLWPKSHFEWIRPGIILYGISPKENNYGKDYGLLPVMRLQSNLIAITKHNKGDTIGYGGIWTSEYNTHIGIISIGYADGYPRNIIPGTPVIINDRKVPIVGRVSMDLISVNLGANIKDKINDPVTIWGHEILPIEEIAKCANTSNYDLTTKLTSRVLFKYFKDK